MCQTQPNSIHCTMKAAGLLALRLALGAIFIYSGYGKLGPIHDMAAGMFDAKFGLPGGGSLWAYIVGTLELVGGLMVLLGVYAKYAATWLAFIMIVAIFGVHLGGPFSGYFTALLSLGSLLAIVGVGAGKWRLVKTQCHCPMCKEKDEKGGCCGGGTCGKK